MMERHPLSAICGDMDPKDFRDLVVDIQERGLIETIITLDGMILDGWHRYKACLETGEQPFFKEHYGVSPVNYVASKNLRRRHSSASVRAQIAVALHAWRPAAGRPKNSATVAELPRSPLDSEPVEEPPLSLNSEEPVTTQQMADEAGVSTRTIERAKAAEKAGLRDEVMSGELSGEAAAQQTKPDKPTKATIKEEKMLGEIAELENENRDLQESLSNLADQQESLMDVTEEERDQALILEQLRNEIRVLKSQVNYHMQATNDWKRECLVLRKKLKKVS